MRSVYFYFLILLMVSCKSDTKRLQTTFPEEKENSTKLLASPSNNNSSLPRLYSNGEKLFMSWVEKKDTINILKYSYLKNENWSTPEDIISGSDWFVNWADFPVISENNGNILTSFLQKSAEGTYTYDVKLNLFNAKKKNWKTNFILHSDGTKSEHGFVSMKPWKSDQFFVTWLDGRNTVGGGHDGSAESGGMTLRGAFVNVDGEIIDDVEIDPLTCDCCQTSVAKTDNGLIVAYRDRSKEEIRDIAIARFDTLNGWNAPQIIGEDHWTIPGCPVNGPSIDAIGNNVVIAWFTAANENPSVKVVFSEDGGASFNFPLRLDHGNAIGRVDVAMIDEENAFICWLEPKGEDTLIQLLKVNLDGTLSETITISKTSAERASGFPQLEIVDQNVYIAWTSLENDGPTINIKSVLINSL